MRKIIDAMLGQTSQSEYDMTVQREIQKLQNRQFLHSILKSQIATRDGEGRDDVIIVPDTTGMTLNRRFSLL